MIGSCGKRFLWQIDGVTMIGSCGKLLRMCFCPVTLKIPTYRLLSVCGDFLYLFCIYFVILNGKN